MKALNTLQVLSKIARILSKIVFICCIVAAAGCAVGMISIPFADKGVIKIGGVSIHGLLANRAGIVLESLYPLLTGAMTVCIGQAVTARFAEAYFAHELAAGTPFSLPEAKELLRLGILTITVPLGTQILSQIASGILAELIGCGDAFHLDNDGSVALGVMFIVASLLCRYGAECQIQTPEKYDTE